MNENIRVGISSALGHQLSSQKAERMRNSVGWTVRSHPSGSRDTAIVGIDRRIWFVAVHTTLINAYTRLVDR